MLFFLKLYNKIDLKDILMRKIDPVMVRQVEYIEIFGIGKKSRYLTFVPRCIEIDGKKFEGKRLAVSMKDFGDYDVVLSNDFIGGEL